MKRITENMLLVREIRWLLWKELVSEWRQQYSLYGVLLYVVAAIFVVYLSFRFFIDEQTWNALYWIILLFASVNAAVRSFITESEGRLLYYYTIASAHAIIFSRIIYNSLLLVLVGLLSFAGFSLMLGNPVANLELFLLAILIGCVGFASMLTFVSAIASWASNKTLLMATLSFPVVLPFLLILIRLSIKAINGLTWQNSISDILILISIDTIVICLIYLLFPYLWRG